MVAEKLVKEQASVKTDLEMAVCFSTFCIVFLYLTGSFTETSVVRVIDLHELKLFLKFYPSCPVTILVSAWFRFGLWLDSSHQQKSCVLVD
jgi:hypothetical protein